MPSPDSVKTRWEEIPAGGFAIKAFVAEPEVVADKRALVVIHENPGITEWRQEETQRMAADLGWTVVVMNTYSRIGGEPPAGPFETQDERRRAAFLAMPDEQVARDLETTIDWVKRQDFAGGHIPAVLGFCSGGGQGIYAVGTRKGLASCLVVVYGNILLPGELTEDEQPIDRVPLVPDLDCPVQYHVGTADVAINGADVDRFEAALVKAGKTHEVYRYEGANHVFADPTHPNYDAAASSQVWERVYAFLRQYGD